MIKRYVSVDFSKRTGKLKPILCANTGPCFGKDLEHSFIDEYKEMGISFVRTHNVEHPYGAGRYIDVHCIFPDFDLDPRFESSYNFAPTDRYIATVKASGADIFLRIGESSEPYETRIYNRAPADLDKWICIVEHIIAHYNRGWANGFKLGIKYCELPCDVDEDHGWASDKEEYFELYRRTALRLKEVYPKLRVGAYSSGGFYSLNHYNASEKQKRYVSFLEDFLAFVTKPAIAAPLDFLTWKCCAESPEELSLHANYARSYLNQRGLKRTQSIVSEFKLKPMKEPHYLRRFYPAELASALIIAEKSSVDMLFMSDMSPFDMGCALYSLEDRTVKRKYAPYGVMSAFGKLSSLATTVDVSEDYRRELYIIATASEEEGAVIVVTREFDGQIELNLKGSEFSSYSIKGMIGGGERGVGFSTSEQDLPLRAPCINLKAGKNEVYFITLKKQP